MGEVPERRRFLKAVGLGAAAVGVAAAVPLAGAGRAESRGEKNPLRKEEDKRNWRERRKSITRGFEPEYRDEFP